MEVDVEKQVKLLEIRRDDRSDDSRVITKEEGAYGSESCDKEIEEDTHWVVGPMTIVEKMAIWMLGLYREPTCHCASLIDYRLLYAARDHSATRHGFNVQGLNRKKLVPGLSTLSAPVLEITITSD